MKFYSPDTVKQHLAYFMPASLLIQVLIILLLFVAPALATEILLDQAATPQRVSAEALPAPDAVSSAPHLSSLETERIACFDRLWSSYQEDVWFYGENEQRIVPESSLEWLVVRLLGTPGQVDALPTAVTDSFPTGTLESPSPSLESFNAGYGEYFSHFLRDPELGAAMTAYRLRRDMPREVFQTLMARLQQDPQVMYAHPAWKISDQLYAPLEGIEVTWKTSASNQQRNALLQAVGAVAADTGSVANRQRVTIVPCQQSVWQAANLLAEDIHVAQARPLLMPLVPPVSVEFSLGMNGAMPGTPLPFTFKIRFTDKVKIDSSTIANLNLKPRGIFHNLFDIRYDVPLSAVDVNRSPICITGQMKIYATGDYNLPEIPVYFSDKGAPKTKIQVIKTAAVPVRIASIIPETQQNFDLLVGQPDPIPMMNTSAATRAKHRNVLLMLAGVFLIGLAGATLALLKRSRRQQAVQPENHALVHKQAAASEAILVVQQHPGLREIATLGISLKNYLAELVGLDENRRGGSHTAFFRRIEEMLPSASRASAAEVLSIIDHVLARGDQTAVPATLPGQAARLIDELRASDETAPDLFEKH
ncbi:hypothetical protein A7E78_06265 [Syntrophotalea acetylenivorans]|uniref:Uncharacterized protein n=1 Tax=Syntrophotalea acetylenivorans TaxID=1842532 RepID=A0A1L3GNH0_9BACT|nr:hypothetical protein [Syntrophotalea acetylenivorans]APG27479.1 hypothetical protein A7E78_06265 [Syntrophotalea acetylenivorans]